MDDSIDNVENDDEGVELYRQLKALWGVANMQARKWISNSPKVIEAIPKEEYATEIVISNGQVPITKTLGISWNSTEDVFTVTASPVSAEFQTTKQSVLRKVATIFDPLGFICQAGMRGYSWDEKIQDEIANKIGNWFKKLKSLRGVKIPRCLRSPEPVKSKRIVTFVDASRQAYGAAVFIQCEHGHDSGAALNTDLTHSPRCTNAERDFLLCQYRCFVVDSRAWQRLPTVRSQPNW